MSRILGRLYLANRSLPPFKRIRRLPIHQAVNKTLSNKRPVIIFRSHNQGHATSRQDYDGIALNSGGDSKAYSSPSGANQPPSAQDTASRTPSPISHHSACAHFLAFSDSLGTTRCSRRVPLSMRRLLRCIYSRTMI